MQDETLAVGEPDAERPVLPRDEVPVDRESGTLGLSDLERRDRAVRTPGAGAVVAGLGRHRDDAVVFELDDVERLEIEDRDEAGDRARVAVVVDALAVPDRSPRQTAVS